MKDLKTLILHNTEKACLSSIGYYGYWYHDPSHPVIIKKGAEIKHLHLWKNQDPYLAFLIKACNIEQGLISDLKPDANVCIWLHKKNLLPYLDHKVPGAVKVSTD